MAHAPHVSRRRFVAAASALASAAALPEVAAAAVQAAVEAPAAARGVAVSAGRSFPINPQPWIAPMQGVEVNPWVVIGADNAVLIRVNSVELGQGTFTSNPMMVCEELDCDWNSVHAVYADTNRHMRGKLLYDHLVTGSSSSVRNGRVLYQKVGADARERLRAAAAQRFGVPVAEVDAKAGVLIHRPSDRRLRYADVADEAARVTLTVEPAIKPPNQYTLIGRRLPRMLDVELKTYALATFGIDVRLPDMVYAAIKQSPTFGSTLQHFDFDAVKGRRGVIAALAVDVRAFGADIGFSDGIPDASGVAVVADSWWRAKTALDALPIVWSPGPADTMGSDAMFASFEAKLTQPGLVAADRGDVDGALRAATTTVEATYRAPYLAHAPMEPMNCTAQVTEDRVEVWAPTQCPEWAATLAAKVAGVPIEKVYVNATFIGGSFGRRYNQDFVAQAVAIAKTLNGRPVKLVWSREEDVRRDNSFHPADTFRGQAALGPDGMPVAALVRKAGDVYGGSIVVGPHNVKMRRTIHGLDSIPYAIPNLRVEAHEVKSPFPTAWLRGTSSIWSIFFLESFIDECAHAAGQDPYQYRRKLIAAAPPEAFDSNTQQQWLHVLDLAAHNAGWGSPLPKGMGRGIAIDDRHDVPSRKLGNVPAAVVATVSVSDRGAVSVRRIDIALDSGYATIDPLAVERNLRGQVAWAMSLGRQELTFRNGAAVQGNFDALPVARMADYPKEVNVALVKSDHWIYGIGEEVVSQVLPAIGNAIFAATGKRVRSLPLRTVEV